MSRPTSEIAHTPSGVRIAYFDKSHRYKIGQDAEGMEFVPSVSTILEKALPKNLAGWAERLGVEGLREAVVEGHIDRLDGWTTDELLELLTSRRLRYWQKRDQAALRGTSVHAAFETLALGQGIKVSRYPVAERGYIRAIAAWWHDHEPKVHSAELMVCSWEHRYAGRMDLLAETNRHDGLGVYDLKTSKAVRESHHFQTAGYRLAVHESGHGDPSHGCIVRVGDDANFECVPSWATHEQFIALVNSYRAQKQFEKDTPPKYKRSRKKAA